MNLIRILLEKECSIFISPYFLLHFIAISIYLTSFDIFIHKFLCLFLFLELTL